MFWFNRPETQRVKSF